MPRAGHVTRGPPVNAPLLLPLSSSSPLASRVLTTVPKEEVRMATIGREATCLGARTPLILSCCQVGVTTGPRALGPSHYCVTSGEPMPPQPNFLPVQQGHNPC